VLLENYSKPDPKNRKWLPRATNGTNVAEAKVPENEGSFMVTWGNCHQSSPS